MFRSRCIIIDRHSQFIVDVLTIEYNTVNELALCLEKLLRESGGGGVLEPADLPDHAQYRGSDIFEWFSESYKAICVQLDRVTVDLM